MSEFPGIFGFIKLRRIFYTENTGRAQLKKINLRETAWSDLMKQLKKKTLRSEDHRCWSHETLEYAPHPSCSPSQGWSSYAVGHNQQQKGVDLILRK
jgi:hypothetical protein